MPLTELWDDGGTLTGERVRSEEHTSELQSQSNLVCRLLLEKKKNYLSRLKHVDYLSYGKDQQISLTPKVKYMPSNEHLYMLSLIHVHPCRAHYMHVATASN